MQYAFMPWPLSYSCGCLILPLIACIFCIVVVAVLSLSRKASAHFLALSLSLSGLWIRADNIMFYYYCHLCVRKAYRVWYAMYGIYALMNDDNTK